MNSEKMRTAGGQLQNLAYADDELKNCLKGAILALEFLEGAGEGWRLATHALRWEVDRLFGFQKERRENA